MKMVIAALLALGGGGLLASTDADGTFTGQVDHINEKSQLLRIHTVSLNAKYLGPGDVIALGDHGGMTECRGDVLARSKEHVLLKLPRFHYCSRTLPIKARGVWLKFYGQSLSEKVAKGRKLVEILLKKRLALMGRLGEREKDLKRQGEKIDIANRQYSILREQVELAWRDALGELEGERTKMINQRTEAQKSLADIDKQLEKYRVDDKVWELDRWSLDERFYFKK